MTLITTASDLPERVGEAELLAVDLETCDPRLPDYGPGDVRGPDGWVAGVGIAAEDGPAFYVPTGHEEGPCVEREAVSRWLRAELEGRRYPITGANFNYDRGWLYADFGVDLVGVPNHDTQIAEPLIDETKMSYSLDATSRDYGIEGGKADEPLYELLANKCGGRATRKQQGGNIWRAPSDSPELYDYLMSDLRNPLHIIRKQYARLRELGLLDAFRREVVISDIVLLMRRRGIRVDVEKAERMEHELEDEIGTIRQSLGIESLWAPDELEPLCRHHGLTPPRTPKTDKVSITKSYLQGLANDGHTFAEQILRGRKIDHAMNTFVKSYVLDFVAPDGRVHGQFHHLRDDENGTITGRFCVSADTLIETDTGRQRIDSVTPGETRVRSHTGRWNTVLHRVYKGWEKMVSVCFSDGNVLQCTRNHRLLTDSGWKSVRDLKQGDEVIRYVGQQDAVQRSGDPEAGSEHLPVRGQTDRESDGGTGGRHLPDSEGNRRTSGRGDVQAGEGDPVLEVEDRIEESGVEEDRGGPPELQTAAHDREERVHVSTPTGLDDVAPYAEAGAGASGRGVSNVGCHRVTERAPRASYRRGCNEQRAVESCDRDEHRASETARTVTVASIDALGSTPVWDIEVERDHSYAAAGVFHHNSSSSPNLQNIPSRDPEIGPMIRGLFVPDEGEDWYSHDYSQIEPRLTLHYATGREAEAMRDAYRNDPAIDCYDTMISALSQEGLTRKPVKNIWLGLLYGMGMDKLCADLGVDRARGDELIAIFDDAAPYVKQLKRGVSNTAKRRGWLRTIGGRRANFPLWEPADFNLKFAKTSDGKFRFPPTRDPVAMRTMLQEAGYSPRAARAWVHKALNKLIQGGASDLMKAAMVDQYEAGVFDTLGPPLATVHDEVDWSVPRTAEGREAVAEARRIMTNPSVQTDIPLQVDEETGPDWGHIE